MLQTKQGRFPMSERMAFDHNPKNLNHRPSSKKIIYICPSPNTDAEDREHEKGIILGPVILHICYEKRSLSSNETERMGRKKCGRTMQIGFLKWTSDVLRVYAPGWNVIQLPFEGDGGVSIIKSDPGWC
jgi:hypothetical protein